MNMRRAAIIAVIVIAGLLTGFMVAWFTGQQEPSGGPPSGGDFTLQSADGPVSLADLRGKVVLVYFGYAGCPDVCPTSLALTAQALRALTPAELVRVRVLFVSVDPERDTPQRLMQYTAHFHGQITGVTGSPEALADIAARYGVAYRKQAVESAAKYVVDHTSVTSVIAPDGLLAEQLLHGTPPEEIVQAIRRLL